MTQNERFPGLDKATTSITDRYEVNITLPPYEEDRDLFVTSPGPGVEVIHIKVTLDPAADEPGKYFADFTATGYPLTKAGARGKRKAYADTLYWGGEDEARWNLRREAILATLERHGIDPSVVVVNADGLDTWADHSSKLRDYYQSRFGGSKEK